MMRSMFCMLGLLLVTAVAYAHHGWSEYDNATTLKLTGVIKEAGYEHPHGHVRLETPGKPEEMRAERIIVSGKTIELR